ncbi:acyl-CoA dehydrogenase family protein [Dyadobacter sandarakinus]|uniref:Acyl-CoA dehydrogenase family protein n=1 Tax=Dyadobacter sandarakinus TaxID=2747268 RepID=A0ABX7I5T5_9BACT|nr:acyl-CoA dehydrogenase family protein [Dyadobacter sandarakinus]QRR01464.1 acyl-CoA dehydrogenase family protein [Dyadobacter sandarakinus]
MINTTNSTIQDQLYNERLFAEIAAASAASDYDGGFPAHEFALLRASGLLTITLPGQALCYDKASTPGLLQLLKNIGKSSLPVGRIYEGHINALLLIASFGSQDQKSRWFEDAGANLFGVWNTQDAGGLEIEDTGNGRYRLTGSKTFCSGAGWIGRPLVTGKLISPEKSGWQMCIIPTETVKPILADSSFWKPLGMQASASYRMDLTGIEIGEQDLLGLPDDYYRQPLFGSGALRFAAVQLGGAEAVLEETHRLLNDFKRTEDPFQQSRIAEISYLIETGNLWLNQAGELYDRWLHMPGSAEKLIAYANMTRTIIEDACLRSMQLAERSVGSRGLMRPGILERMHRDLTTYLRQPAPDAIQAYVGKYVLDQQNTTSLWT